MLITLGVVVASLILSGTLLHVVVRLEAQKAAEDAATLPIEDVVARASARENALAIDRLTLAVGEGIQNVTRIQNRITATVKSARKNLAEAGIESAALEGEWGELEHVDAEGSEDDEVPALPLFLDPASGGSPDAFRPASMEQLRADNRARMGL